MSPVWENITASANAVATAASTALPPLASTSRPTTDASPEAETTTPLGVVTDEAHPSATTHSARRSKRMTGIYRARTREDTGKPESLPVPPEKCIGIKSGQWSHGHVRTHEVLTVRHAAQAGDHGEVCQGACLQDVGREATASDLG